MIIHTNTERVKGSRKIALELLLSDHVEIVVRLVLWHVLHKQTARICRIDRKRSI